MEMRLRREQLRKIANPVYKSMKQQISSQAYLNYNNIIDFSADNVQDLLKKTLFNECKDQTERKQSHQDLSSYLKTKLKI